MWYLVGYGIACTLLGCGTGYYRLHREERLAAIVQSNKK